MQRHFFSDSRERRRNSSSDLVSISSLVRTLKQGSSDLTLTIPMVQVAKSDGSYLAIRRTERIGIECIWSYCRWQSSRADKLRNWKTETTCSVTVLRQFTKFYCANSRCACLTWLLWFRPERVTQFIGIITERWLYPFHLSWLSGLWATYKCFQRVDIFIKMRNLQAFGKPSTTLLSLSLCIYG